jgi:hypothetical protein
VDAGAVGQAGVDDRGRAVGPQPQPGHDPFDQQVDGRPIDHHVGARQAPAALHPHMTGPVHEHIAHGRVGQERFQGADPVDAGPDPGDHLPHGHPVEQRAFLAHQLGDRLVAHQLVAVEGEDPPMDALVDVEDRVRLHDATPERATGADAPR